MNCKTKTALAALTGPALVAALTGLAWWMFPPSLGNVAPFVIPQRVEPGPVIPQTLVNLQAGQEVGESARWGDFEIKQGWDLQLDPSGSGTNFNAEVTNVGDEMKVARVQVKVYAGHSIRSLVLCRVTLHPGETGRFICWDSYRRYTPHWNRVLIESS